MKWGLPQIGFAYVPPYRNYAVTIQALERLEFGVNYTTYIGVPDPAMGDLGFGDFTDRGANVKIAMLKKEDGFPYFPEISVGNGGFLWNQKISCLSMWLATKEFLDYNFEATVGWGKGRIKGWFGGFGWTPFRRSQVPGINRLTLLAEWDATDYKNHFHEHPEGRGVKSRVNVGLTTTFFDTLQLSVSSIRGEKVAASASLNYNLGDTTGFFPKVDNPSIYRTPLDTQPLGYLRSERELSRELALAFSGARSQCLSDLYYDRQRKWTLSLD